MNPTNPEKPPEVKFDPAQEKMIKHAGHRKRVARVPTKGLPPMPQDQTQQLAAPPSILQALGLEQ